MFCLEANILTSLDFFPESSLIKLIRGTSEEELSVKANAIENSIFSFDLLAEIKRGLMREIDRYDFFI